MIGLLFAPRRMKIAFRFMKSIHADSCCCKQHQNWLILSAAKFDAPCFQKPSISAPHPLSPPAAPSPNDFHDSSHQICVKQNYRSRSHCSRDRDCTSRGKCSFLTLPHAMRATKLAGTLTLLSCANSKPKPTVNSQGSKILLRDLPTTKWPTCRLQQISARMRSPLQQGFG